MDIVDFILSQGYKEEEFTLPLFPHEKCIRYFYKSIIAGENCQLNDKLPNVVIHQRVYKNYPNALNTSYDMSIGGEVNGVWFSIEAQSIDEGSLGAGFTILETKLIACWNLLHI